MRKCTISTEGMQGNESAAYVGLHRGVHILFVFLYKNARQVVIKGDCGLYVYKLKL